MASRPRTRLLHHALWFLAAATALAACSGRSTRTVTTEDAAGRGASGGNGGSATFGGSSGRGGRGGSGAAAGTGGFGIGPGLDGGSGPVPRGGTAGGGTAGEAGRGLAGTGTIFPCIPSNAGSATVGACVNSFWHRPVPETCRLPERQGETAGGAAGDAGFAGAGGAAPENPDGECAVDTDCNAKPHGYCVRAGAPSLFAYRCHYACESDDECDLDQACACDTQFDIGADTGLSAVISRCVPADCRLDSQCGAGFACLAVGEYDCNESFGPGSYHCQSSNDYCGPPGCNSVPCSYVNDHYECAEPKVCGGF